MSRSCDEIKLSLCEAMNIPVLQQQYFCNKLTDVFHELSSPNIKLVLENLEENIYDICSKEPPQNTSKLEYLLEKIEGAVYNICYSRNIIVKYNK
jgi:hypothetical protein